MDAAILSRLEDRDAELTRVEVLLAGHGAPGEGVEEKVRNLMSVALLSPLMREDRDRWRARARCATPLQERLRR
jgi:hypothetical protein